MLYDISADRRISAVDLLVKAIDINNTKCANVFMTARNIEADIHDTSLNDQHYMDNILKCSVLCKVNPSAHQIEQLVCAPEDVTLKGTILERINTTENERRRLFNQMLQEKYDSLDACSSQYTSSLACRRCKSTDVSWEQKQTRSADEGMTVYCVCSACNHRWTMR